LVSAPPDLAAKAKGIVEAAEARGVVLRVLGGVSFLIRCPSAARAALQREYLDIDFAGYSKQSKEIGRVFEGFGYVPREMFNAMQGRRRLIFNDMVNQRRADVFLDVFEMCHKIDLRKRLEVDKYTISLADMLATKLQIVEINEKDMKDVASLLADYDIGSADTGAVNGKYIASLCSGDWGIYRTFTANLGKIQEAVARTDLDEASKATVVERAARLRKEIEAAPKSFGWTLRAKVGDRARWYDLPEPDMQIVDSRIAKDKGDGV
jgi:hypothetical protein